MRLYFTLLSMFMLSFAKAQQKPTIYFFPGQGSDKRIFDSLSIDSSFNKVFIEYGIPAKNTSLQQFAKQLSVQIDTTQEFILIGVSLGGMICCELNEQLHPKKVIIISSAKNRNELPFRYKFQRILPLYKIFPPRMLHAGAKLLQPIVEPDRNKNKKVFKSMLYSKNPTYIKRTINMIITWNRKSNTKKNYQVHGTKDHTLPIRKIKVPDYIVYQGSHMMTLTLHKEISLILNKIVLGAE